MSNEEYGVEIRTARPTVGFTRSIAMDGFAEVVDRLPGLFAELGARGLAPAGPPYFRYHVIDMERELVVEAGVPIEDPHDPRVVDLLAAAPDLHPGELPAGRYAVHVHRGHPDTLVAATGALLDWGRSQDLDWDARPGPRGEEWGCRLENYLTDPMEQPDMDQWDTELAFRLAD